MTKIRKGFMQFEIFWNIRECTLRTRKLNPIICPKKYLPNLIFRKTQKTSQDAASSYRIVPPLRKSG